MKLFKTWNPKQPAGYKGSPLTTVVGTRAELWKATTVRARESSVHHRCKTLCQVFPNPARARSERVLPY